jgi:hypothetical protein
MGNCLGKCSGNSKKEKKQEPTLTEVVAMLQAMRQDLDAKQDTMLALLRTSVPAYAIRDVPRCVFPADTSKENVAVNGDLATWSLVEHADADGSDNKTLQSTYFAVSAAHCALLFGDSADYTFMPLPRSVLRCGVVSVRFVVSPKTFERTSIQRRYDFVAVELKQRPNVAVVPEAAIWPETALCQGSITGCSVVGRTNTHSVTAVNCTPVDEHWCAFSETTSEGGSSGALLFRSDAVTATPALMHIAGAGKVVKRDSAIIFPIVMPMVQFAPMGVDALGTTLTWKVPSTESLRVEPHPDENERAKEEETGNVTIQVLPLAVPDCDDANIVKLDRACACGYGELIGVLLDFTTPYRPYRVKKDEIQAGWVGPANVAKPEARALLEALMGTNRVDRQLAALDGLSRIGPVVGSTGVHLVCHVIDQAQAGSGSVDPATAVRALEVLPQLVTGECNDSASCEVALETARNACSRGTWNVREAATAAIQKISDFRSQQTLPE